MGRKAFKKAGTHGRFMPNPGQQWTTPVPPASEKRIFTVDAVSVNAAIQVRETFGWRLVGSSARSYSTGGSIVGAAAGEGVSVGGGQLRLNTTHLTDLTMTRTLNPRGLRLQELESRYEGVSFKQNVGLITFGVWLGSILGFIAIVTGIGSLLSLIVGDSNVAWLQAVGPLACFVAGTVVALVFHARHGGKVKAYNQEQAQLKQSLLLQARALRGP
jgi:hypothetical protein